jgi:hypothetical protein
MSSKSSKLSSVTNLFLTKFILSLLQSSKKRTRWKERREDEADGLMTAHDLDYLQCSSSKSIF